MLEARKGLEVEIAGLASVKSSQKDIAAIEMEWNKMKLALGNILKKMEIDRAFYIRIPEKLLIVYYFS